MTFGTGLALIIAYYILPFVSIILLALMIFLYIHFSILRPERKEKKRMEEIKRQAEIQKVKDEQMQEFKNKLIKEEQAYRR